MSYLTNYLSNQEPAGENPYSQIQSTFTSPSGVQVNRKPGDVFADITRAQAMDYEQRFLPIEGLANAAIMDPERRGELTQQALNIADNAVDSSFARAQGRMSMLQSRFNNTQRPDERSANNRENEVQKRAAKVHARNSTRSYLRDREDALLMGSSS
jgi:hypothetical protein